MPSRLEPEGDMNETMRGGEPLFVPKTTRQRHSTTAHNTTTTFQVLPPSHAESMDLCKYHCAGKRDVLDFVLGRHSLITHRRSI